MDLSTQIKSISDKSKELDTDMKELKIKTSKQEEALEKIRVTVKRSGKVKKK